MSRIEELVSFLLKDELASFDEAHAIIAGMMLMHDLFQGEEPRDEGLEKLRLELVRRFGQNFKEQCLSMGEAC
ncbi:MAG: hypothetical protein ACXABF_17495 [Candidatus Thorarchaeota archaeon]|jgi:hypothetical protein